MRRLACVLATDNLRDNRLHSLNSLTFVCNEGPPGVNPLFLFVYSIIQHELFCSRSNHSANARVLAAAGRRRRQSFAHHSKLAHWVYIVEFEQRGENRARYGQNLIAEIAKAAAIKRLSQTNLKLNRQFYLLYPQIGQTVSDQLKSDGFYLEPMKNQKAIREAAMPELEKIARAALPKPRMSYRRKHLSIGYPSPILRNCCPLTTRSNELSTKLNA